VAIRDVGLCIPTWAPHLGASPDGVVFDQDDPHAQPWLLEVKCIYDISVVPRTIRQVAEERGKRFYCTLMPDGNLAIYKRHQYYSQILGQLGITGLTTAHLAIYAPRRKEIEVVRVDFNEEDWTLLKGKLDNFYRNYMEVVEPMDIGDGVTVEYLRDSMDTS